MENLLTDKVGIIMVFSLQNLQQFLYSSTIQAFTHKSNDIILVQIFFYHVYYSHYWSITVMISQSVGLKVLQNP